MKNNGVLRLLSLILLLAVILPVIPAVSSAEAAAPLSADKLWRQIDALRATVPKRGAVADETAFAAISEEVYTLVEASGTAAPGTLAANGDFIRWVDRETGIPCCYSPAHEAVRSGMPAQRTENEAALPAAGPARAKASGVCPQSLNVGLLQPYWESAEDYAGSGFLRFSPVFVQQAALLAQKTGGEVIRFSMANVTADSIAYTLQNCGIVLINTHGLTDYHDESDQTSRANSSYLWLISGSDSIEALETLLAPEDYTAAHTGPYGTYYDAYYSGGGNYCINGTVIANHMTADAPGSLVYIGCCLSMATDGLAAPLRQRGVEAVVGFSQTVTFKGECAYMHCMTESLLGGRSLAQAMAAAKREVGLTDPYKHKNPCYPIVVSSADPYPENADAPQTVASAWRLSTHQVTYSVPIGVSPIPDGFCGDGGSVTLPAAENAEGYTFAGWSSVPIGSEPSAPELLHDNETCSPRGNVILHAAYRKDADGSFTTSPDTGCAHEAWTAVVTAPTCLRGGETTNTCTGCGAVWISNDTDALGHAYVDQPGQAPTCTENGWDAYQLCARCGHSTHKDYVTIPKLEHAFRSTVVAPTCTALGYTLFECTREGCGYVEKTYWTSKLGHDKIDHPAKAATCTEAGWKAYQTCSRCDYTTYKETAALGHDWNDGEVTRPPTERTDGERIFTCKRCEAIRIERIPATGADACRHEHAHPARKDATCTEDGYDRMICDDCGAVVSEEFLPALGHDFADGVCTRCGEKDPDYQPPVVPGDLNGDGDVDTIDSIRLAKFLVELVELTNEQKLAADVNGDGDVTALDGIRLAKYLVGLVENLQPAPAKATTCAPKPH